MTQVQLLDSITAPWSPPSPDQVAYASKADRLGNDDFLRMLVTQLRYQNPLEPMADTEFIAQLAQFSTLEQMQSMNANLQVNMQLTQSLGNALATSLIGKHVSAVGDSVYLSESGDAQIRYGLSEGAEVTLRISGSDGYSIRTLEAGSQSSGDHTIRWDGKDDAGKRVKEGTYTYQAEAVDAEGNPVALGTYSEGRITGVRFVEGGAVLLVGDMEVKLSDVIEIIGSQEPD